MWTCHFSLLLNPCHLAALEKDNLCSVSQNNINSQCFSGAIRCLCCLDWNHQRGDSRSRYWHCGHHGCFSDHPTKQDQQQCMLSLHCATQFFQFHLLRHENVFQCFSTAWKHLCTLVCDPHKLACHLGAYHWDVGRDVYMRMRAYVYRQMYVFPPGYFD